jgi:hypothetical protein
MTALVVIRSSYEERRATHVNTAPEAGAVKILLNETPPAIGRAANSPIDQSVTW